MSRAARSLCALLTLGLLAVPAVAKNPPGAATPQELVARLHAAAEHNDFGELVDCIAPKDRREMAAGMVVATTMMMAFLDMGSEMGAAMAEGASAAAGEETAEQKAAAAKAKAEAQKATAAMKEKHAAIMSRYGLDKKMESMQQPKEGTPPEEALAALLAGIDERALIVDLMGLMQSMPGAKETKSSPMALPGAVTDYKIDGDHATAKAGDEVIKFVRVDGRWYLAPEQKKPATGESGT